MKQIRTVALFLLIGLSIVMVGYKIYNSIFQLRNINLNKEMVMKWENHIQPLHEAMPSKINQVGYIDKSVILGNPELFDIEEFLLMQYSVAPVVLKTGTNYRWVIGNFDRDVDFHSWLDENLINYNIQSFSFNLYLIENTIINP